MILAAILAGLYFAGVVALPWGQSEPKPLCYVSPKNPNFIKETPGQDPEGNTLVPVYPTPAAGQPPATGPVVAPTVKPAGKTKYWRCPMHPEIVREAPANVRSAAWTWCRSRPKQPRPPRFRLPLPHGSAERAQDQVLGVAHGPRLCSGQARQGSLRHGYGAGL